MEAAKRHELTDAELQKDSVEGLAIAWSRALAVEGRGSPDDLVHAVEAVTVADVDRVARTYLDPERSVVAVLTPRASGEPVPARAPAGAESFAPEHVEQVSLPPWAETALRFPSMPTSGVHPVDITLPNGLRLLIQPESVSRTVSVYGHVRNAPGLEALPGQEGVDEVLDRLFRYGTTSLDRLAFQRALDEIGAQEWAAADFAVRVLHEHFELRPRHLHKRALLDPLQFRRHSIRGYQHALNAKRVEGIFIGGGTGGRDDEKTGNQKPETRKKRSRGLAPEAVRFAGELIHGRKSSNIFFSRF